jgi:hypothetical protein
MLNVAGAIVFAGFLAAAAAAALAPAGDARRRAASRFVLYVVLVSLAAALFQRDLWPFARWPMAGGLADAWAETTRVRAVDTDGAEHDIDARAFEPLEADELIPWLHRSFDRLSRAQQDAVASHLLALAEAARTRARAGGEPGRFARPLGPLSAPGFNLRPRPWSDRLRMPARAFARLRIYRERWNQEERRRDPARVERRLVFEYPAP